MQYLKDVVKCYSKAEHEQFKTDENWPTHMTNKGVHVFAREVPVNTLNESERNSPCHEMQEYFLFDRCTFEYLSEFYEHHHC